MEQYKKEITVFSLEEGGRVILFFDKKMIFEIPEKSFDRRAFDIKLRDKELTFCFGCKSVNFHVIKSEYELLEGTSPATFSGKVLKNILTKKVASKSPIISESEDYFILKNQRAYKKTEYYSEDFDFSCPTSIVNKKIGYKTGLYYEGHFLGEQEKVKEKLKEFVEFGEAVLTFVNEDKKEE